LGVFSQGGATGGSRYHSSIASLSCLNSTSHRILGWSPNFGVVTEFWPYMVGASDDRFDS
jgi:hypothetical protein